MHREQMKQIIRRTRLEWFMFNHSVATTAIKLIHQYICTRMRMCLGASVVCQTTESTRPAGAQSSEHTECTAASHSVLVATSEQYVSTFQGNRHRTHTHQKVWFIEWIRNWSPNDQQRRSVDELNASHSQRRILVATIQQRWVRCRLDVIRRKAKLFTSRVWFCFSLLPPSHRSNERIRHIRIIHTDRAHRYTIYLSISSFQTGCRNWSIQGGE